MESKLAVEAKLALLAAARRLTPEQRLNAFLAHSQLMMELDAAGQKLRAAQQNVRSENDGALDDRVLKQAALALGGSD